MSACELPTPSISVERIAPANPSLRQHGPNNNMRYALLIVLLLAGSLSAAADAPVDTPIESPTIRFRVVIDAPREYRRMLEQGLDLVRWQNDERVTMPLLFVQILKNLLFRLLKKEFPIIY